MAEGVCTNSLTQCVCVCVRVRVHVRARVCRILSYRCICISLLPHTIVLGAMAWAHVVTSATCLDRSCEAAVVPATFQDQELT